MIKTIRNLLNWKDEETFDEQLPITQVFFVGLFNSNNKYVSKSFNGHLDV
jgi:hypothetical protein